MNFLKNKVNKLIKRSIKAQTNRWFSVRDSMISATDVSTILSYNSNSTYTDLLQKKLYNLRSTDNIYTLHGKKFESQAIKVLETKINTNIKEIGFVKSDKYEFIGATPDGITILNNEIYLIEIKCPLTRLIDGNVPFNYYTQMQIQMQVCDVKKCLFFECNFEEISKEQFEPNNNLHGYNKEYNSYWILHDSNLVLVERDDDFFQKHYNKLHSFHKELVNLKNKKKSNNKKRSIQEVNVEEQPQKKGSLVNYEDFKLGKGFIRDYLDNNKCDSWLSFYGKKYYIENWKKNKFTGELIKKNKQTRKKYTDKLKNKCDVNGVSYMSIPKFYKFVPDLFEMTTKYMSLDYDIIINPYLFDNETNTYSNPTYLIKYKVFDKVFDRQNDLSFNGDPDSYCIVNKVNKNINLINNGTQISRDKKHSHFYYNNLFDNYILNKIQGTNLKETFLVGSKWYKKIKGERIDIGIEDEYIGTYEHCDKEGKDFVNNYVNWVSDIKNQDDKFIFYKDKTFLPYLESNENTDWTDFKKTLLVEQNDVNLLYGISKIKKKVLYDNQIYSWKDHKLLDFLDNDRLKMPHVTQEIIREIVKLNTQNEKLISPQIVKNYNNWLEKDSLEIYTDFETVNDFLGDISMIYLVGMYVKLPDNNFEYYYFLADSLTHESERKMMNEWLNAIENIKRKYNVNYEPPIYCWSSAEKNFIKAYNRTHNDNININFVDILDIIKKEKILVKDNIYGFSIKSYVEYMYKHNMINRNYKLDCNSGDLSIVSAINYYKDQNQKEKSNLIKYNTVDCCVMYDILEYFRNHYNK
jgi:putative phage-type endonuclease